MSTYDQIVEEGREDAFRAMLKIAHRQGIDIVALARQYTDLPADRIQRIIDEIQKT